MIFCPRCQRTHPDEAVYCYFDGTPLRPVDENPETVDAPLPAKTDELPFPFVFPGGRSCRTFNELIKASWQEWDSACELFQQGAFQKYLAGAGRFDLAKAVDDAQEQCEDLEIGLAQFLSNLSDDDYPRAQLELEPRRLLVGSMYSNQTRIIALRVLNVGAGLLHGAINISGNGWLRFADGDLLCRLKLRKEQVVRLEVCTNGLEAPQHCAAHLAVVTNGGIVEAPVRLEVPVQPFTMAPYAGVDSPRALAERMLGRPKPAVALLHDGTVADWFKANSWDYPLAEALAPGMGAVQQFFEGLRLSRAPHVQLAEPEIEVLCLESRTVQATARLFCLERKWIYATVSSSAAWLKAPSGVYGPQEVKIELEIDSSRLVPDQDHEATLSIRTNGGQELSAKVRARRPRPQPPSQPQPPLRRRSWPPVLTVFCLGLLIRLLILAPAEHFARQQVSGGTDQVPSESLGSSEFVLWFVLATWWPGALAGTLMMYRHGSRWADLPFGLLAGAGTGLIVSGALACLLPALDAFTGQAAGLLVDGGQNGLIWWTCSGLIWGIVFAVGFILVAPAFAKSPRVEVESSSNTEDEV